MSCQTEFILATGLSSCYSKLTATDALPDVRDVPDRGGLETTEAAMSSEQKFAVTMLYVLAMNFMFFAVNRFCREERLDLGYGVGMFTAFAIVLSALYLFVCLA